MTLPLLIEATKKKRAGRWRHCRRSSWSAMGLVPRPVGLLARGRAIMRAPAPAARQRGGLRLAARAARWQRRGGRARMRSVSRHLLGAGEGGSAFCLSVPGLTSSEVGRRVTPRRHRDVLLVRPAGHAVKLDGQDGRNDGFRQIPVTNRVEVHGERVDSIDKNIFRTLYYPTRRFRSRVAPPCPPASFPCLFLATSWHNLVHPLSCPCRPTCSRRSRTRRRRWLRSCARS